MYNFDEVIERKGTSCAKYDGEKAKNPEIIPMWVADMDFETLPEVKEAIIKRASHGVYGYTMLPEAYYQAVIGWMKNRHQFEIEKDWIVTTPGVVTALKLAVQAYTLQPIIDKLLNVHLFLMEKAIHVILICLNKRLLIIK